MKNIAIIAARGGSKRIPKKNTKSFLGKPIISYSIEIAVKSGIFDEVMVSTDDKEIAKVAERYGASVPYMRSESNADDFAPLNDVFVEVKDWYLNNKRRFDTYCLLLPTAPLLTSTLLRTGYNILMNSKFDSVRPVVRFDYPIQRALRLENQKVSFIYPEFYYARSQDLEPAFHDAGMFYFIRPGCDLLGDNKGGFEIDEIHAQDIDDEKDWKLAELKYRCIFE